VASPLLRQHDSIIKVKVDPAIPTFDRILLGHVRTRASSVDACTLLLATSYYGLYALVSTLPPSEYGEYHCVSRKSDLTAAFPVYRFFFDINHILLTITPRSTVNTSMPSVKIVHSLDHLWIHHFDSAFPPFDVYDWSSREACCGSERLLPDEARPGHTCCKAGSEVPRLRSQYSPQPNLGCLPSHLRQDEQTLSSAIYCERVTAGNRAFLSVRKCNLFEHSTSSCRFGNDTGRRRRRFSENLEFFRELLNKSRQQLQTQLSTLRVLDEKACQGRAPLSSPFFLSGYQKLRLESQHVIVQILVFSHMFSHTRHSASSVKEQSDWDIRNKVPVPTDQYSPPCIHLGTNQNKPRN
jgi:hypothetical protein